MNSYQNPAGFFATVFAARPDGRAWLARVAHAAAQRRIEQAVRSVAAAQRQPTRPDLPLDRAW